MFAVFSLLIITYSFAQPETVCRNGDELLAALKGAAPGTRIIAESGEFHLAAATVIELNGERRRPIVIKARKRNGSVITGPSTLILRNSQFVTIEGFVFENESSSAIRLEGSNNIRISRNVFRLKEKGRGSWVMVTGHPSDTTILSHHNTIDRNLFEKKKELGNFITIEGTKKISPAVSQYDVIERNHFRDIGPRAENVLEAIRAGSSDYTLSRGHTILQDNLFERCDGDPEYISIKLSDCTVRGNTFIECLGSLSLRHGNHSTVINNVILGNGRTGSFLDSTGKTWTLGTGGIRFCADSMTIVGNYMEGLTGSGWDATIAATNGDADYFEKKPLTKHFRITNALLERNILVNNASGLEIGFDGAGFQGNWWSKPPEKMTMKNNIIVGSSDTLIKLMDTPIDALFENTIVFPSGKATAYAQSITGVIVKDPSLRSVNGLKMPKGMKASKELRILKANDVGPDSQ
jgi:poly(beta-D-mannuronate) lyase